MADLKINQLDPIIPVSSGTGATYAALSDADLFIVKMKVRGTAIGDEDRKLTWLELKNTLNLGQYMGTVGGNFTGDITLNNNKAVKGQQTGAGADISLIVVDANNRVNVGAITNLTRIQSSSIPQFVDGTGTYNFLTTKNIPAPGDLSGGAAYTKAEVDSALNLKADLAGATFTGAIALVNNKRLYMADASGTNRNALLLNASNNFWVGDANTNLKFSTALQPTVQVGADANNYVLYHAGNKPTAADLNLYTKTEVDTKDAAKLDKSGGTMTGSVFYPNTQGIGFQSGTGQYYNGMTGTGADLQIGDTVQATSRIYSLTNPTVRVGSVATDYLIYHAGNKPTAADLGFDTLLNAKMDKAGGTFTGTVNIANNIHFRSVSGANAATPSTAVDVFYVGTNALAIGDVQQKTFIRGYGDLTYDNGTSNIVYHTGNKPTFTDVGSYSIAQSDAAFARKGVNADITALNALTGALKVGANATQPLEVTTLQQVQALTSGTAGAVVGVVGGFIGAVMWFNGTTATIPAGWVAASGQTLNRADYPDLWAAVNSGALVSATEANWTSTTNLGYRGMYSPGNGSTTFRLPDLNGQYSGSIQGVFLRGMQTGMNTGEIRASKIPNITGNAAINLSGVANIGVQLGSGGALADRSSVTNLLQTASGIQASGSGNTGFTLDASRVSSVYDSSVTEVRPPSVSGIWIIRASNNFQAANTNFAVYNGADTAPASGTLVYGGALQSIYNIQGVQANAVNLSSAQMIGSDAYARLSVISQGTYGSGTTKTYTYTFGSDGLLNVGTLTATGTITAPDLAVQKIEISADQPFIDFHYANSTADYTHRIIANSSTSLQISSGLAVVGALTSNAQILSGSSLAVSGSSGALNSQGMYMRWNENSGTGQGSIIVNPGGGTGGLVVRFINAANTVQNGAINMYANGRLAPSQGYCSKPGVNGSINTGNAWNIERGTDGNNYLWIDTSAFLIPQSTSDLTYKKDVTASKEGALDRVLASKTIEYSWKEEANRDDKRHRGFGAQDQEEVDEMHVVPSAGEFYPMSLDTTAMLADAYDAIKELTAMVKDLQAQVTELKAAKA